MDRQSCGQAQCARKLQRAAGTQAGRSARRIGRASATGSRVEIDTGPVTPKMPRTLLRRPGIQLVDRLQGNDYRNQDRRYQAGGAFFVTGETFDATLKA